MPIFEIKPDGLKAVSVTTFEAEDLLERKHIQRLLRDNIATLDESLMVIDEEFGGWVDSSRRIDLLCLDTDANLVVVEVKRTEDGGHMELQALRYAAMVSTMTFEQLVETFAKFRNKEQPDTDKARTVILEFLGWDEVFEEQFAQDTRIILAAADFGKELTTAVMWLIDRDIDIRCVRMKPYRMESETLLMDVQQVIPLPEATDFQTQIGVKNQAERRSRSDRQGLRLKFWTGLLDLAKTKSDIHANRKPTRDSWISGGIGRAGFSLQYAIRQNDSQVELWISFGAGQAVKNKTAFRALETQKDEIDRDFGSPLEWQPLMDGDGCRIRYVVQGGYKSPMEEWPEIYSALVDAMVRLDRAMRGRVSALKL